MSRFRELNRPQQVFLVLLAALVLLFAVLYAVQVSKVGFSYYGEILVEKEKDGVTTYTGKIKGEKACFTVYSDNSVEFRYGSRVFGPYTIREDPTAIPEDSQWSGSMKGIEISSPQKVIFRGGVTYNTRPQQIVREDGENLTPTISVGTSNKVPGTPSVKTILTLAEDPTLTHKGSWGIWLLGTLLSAVLAFTIFYADELFYWRMSWRVQDPDIVDPSEWEIITRYIGWTISIIAIVAWFIWGMQI